MVEQKENLDVVEEIKEEVKEETPVEEVKDSEEPQKVTQIRAINYDILKQFFGYFSNQCKSRTDARLFKQALDAFVKAYGLNPGEDFAVVKLNR